MADGYGTHSSIFAGWMEFRLCAVNNPTVRATQQCLDRNVLSVVDANGNPQTSQHGPTKTPVNI